MTSENHERQHQIDYMTYPYYQYSPENHQGHNQIDMTYLYDLYSQENHQEQHQIDKNDQYSPNNHQEQYKNLQELISLNERDSYLNKREPLLDKNKRVSDLNEKEFDSTIAPCEFDSSLFGHSTSPIFEPAVDFSPKLSDGNNTKSTMHLTSTVPSSIRQLGLTSALNIPCGSDVINTSNIASDGTMSSVNSHMNTRNILKSPLSSTKLSPAVIVPSKLSPTKPANIRSREELTIKRAKNDAARESCLRKVTKIKSLKKQVYKLQTRIAVLEKELEEENIDKDNRDFPRKRKLIACGICRVQKKRCVGGKIGEESCEHCSQKKKVCSYLQ
ncbi:hypothetical protein F8M41_016218 [Gigaspora margarita]|uniref:Zn(2)-C6 fungal-type domain-containing protein n=1 Tax=Gigaspora margarita TaxID=4874 RepID=A0A8H4APX2_GIGMA|nr:hypothetical protein F8M41_016218 [Gigaspora margarita]